MSSYCYVLSQVWSAIHVDVRASGTGRFIIGETEENIVEIVQSTKMAIDTENHCMEVGTTPKFLKLF